MSTPIALAVRPGEPTAVYIAQQGGQVRRLADRTLSGNVLDISGRIKSGGEQGLLGIAFSPDGNWLYASYTNTDGDTRIVVYPFTNGRANAAAERVILAEDQPYPNHNGGQINFGPDGYLYVALGDGGSGGDPGNRAQNLGTVLGKILRIAPRTSGSPAYTVPADNPFVGNTAARPEIWHYGLRNPWRWSFDRANGEQWIADVGQGDYEEVNHVGAGAKGVNFGWNKREGKHAYNGGAMPAGAIDPEIETTHAAGNCSITGGYVYRGAEIRGFAGTYVFSDYCRGELMAYGGGSLRQFGVHIDSPSSFGEDANGELYVLSTRGGVYRLERK
jgi:glucose/arabinose dehydrogenase